VAATRIPVMATLSFVTRVSWIMRVFVSFFFVVFFLNLPTKPNSALWRINKSHLPLSYPKKRILYALKYCKLFKLLSNLVHLL